MTLGKMLAPLCLVCASFSATAVEAAPIIGSISISGTDTFDSNSITFNPTSAPILAATGSYSSFAPITYPLIATLKSFNFATGSGVNLYSAGTLSGQSTSFTITSLISSYSTSPFGPSLLISGSGFANLTGYDQTYSTFNLQSINSVIEGVTSFGLTVNSAPVVSSAVPEATTWAMMIFGMGAIGFAMRRRKVMTRVRFA